MKFRLILLFLSIAQFSFAQNSAIEVQPKGLNVDTTYFSVGDIKVSGNSFQYGTKLYLQLSGIKGFSIKDGNSFPGCSMKIYSETNEELLSNDDLFSEYKDGLDSKDAHNFYLTLTLGDPIKENSKIRWVSRVWDKANQSEMVITTHVMVTPPVDALGIKRESKGLTPENVYIQGSEPLTSSKVKEGEKISFMITGTKGFKLNGEKKVNLGASMVVRDQQGAVMLEMTDLFKDSKSYDPEDMSLLRLYLTVGDPMAAGVSYTWTVRIWDKNSTNEFVAKATIDIVKAD